MDNNPEMPPARHMGWRGRFRGGRQPWRPGFRTLSDLQPGESAIISDICCRGKLGERLLEMGLTPGTQVEVVRHAPFGGPIEVRVRGYLLLLRRCEAANILVESAS